MNKLKKSIDWSKVGKTKKKRATYKCSECTNPCYRRLVKPPEQKCPAFPRNEAKWFKLNRPIKSKERVLNGGSERR